jgi:uncharacterized membrane protein
MNERRSFSMDLIIVLGVTTLIAWLLRFFRFFSWMTLPIAVSCGLAMMFTFTGIAHFTSMKEDLVRMVPAIFPYPEALIAITGVLELLGAIGLLIPKTRFWAASCLMLLLIVMFPANIKAALEHLPQTGESLWTRAPEQLFYLAVLAFVAFSSRNFKKSIRGIQIDQDQE